MLKLNRARWRAVYWNAALFLMVAAAALLLLQAVFELWNGSTGMMVAGLILLIVLGYCLMEVGFSIWGNLRHLWGERDAEEHVVDGHAVGSDGTEVRDAGEPGVRGHQDQL